MATSNNATTSDIKYRTITLTDRAPVRIREDQWPVIAKGTGDSYGRGDYARYQQALSNGECDRYAIRVREHADGRVIVSAVFDAATAWTGSEDRREGELIKRGDGIVETIRRVGERCGLPDSVIRECIADLPAEDI